KDDKALAARVMFKTVTDFRLPRCHQSRFALRLFRVDKADFAGHMVVGGNDDIAPGSRETHANEEAGISFSIDFLIVLWLSSDLVPHHLARAMIVVQDHVEEEAAVPAPGNRTVAVFQAIRKIMPGLQIPEADSTIFRPGLIESIGKQPMIGRVGDCTNVEECLALGQSISVEQKLLLARFASGPTAEEWMLPPLPKARVIAPGAIRIGHAGIIFLDPPAQLLDEHPAQFVTGLENLFRPAVFGFQISTNVSL